MSPPAARPNVLFPVMLLVSIGAGAGLVSFGLTHAGATRPPGPSTTVDTPAAPARSLRRPPVFRPTGPGVPTVLIESVTVERSEVCEGEPNLVTVVAQAPDGSGGGLRARVGRQPGFRVPLRLWLGPAGEPVFPQVTVSAPDGAEVSAPVPRYSVKPCPRQPRLGLRAQRLVPEEEVFGFKLQVLDPTAPFDDPAATPQMVRWSYGDGHTEETASPETTHGFAESGAGTPPRYVLVEAEATLGDGRRLNAAVSIELLLPTTTCNPETMERREPTCQPD